jgi:hypothetical protein
MTTIATTPNVQPRRATCDSCGASLPPYRGLGKPRVRCPDCAADRSALGKAWRLAHPEAVAAYNGRRRQVGEAGSQLRAVRPRLPEPRRRDARKSLGILVMAGMT